MNPKNSKIAERKTATKIPRTYLLAIGVVLVICIAVVTGMVLMQKTVPIANQTVNATDQENNPWYWYNKAVDLAYAGQYQDALVANEKALAFNESFPVALSNKAGILVKLGRYDEAITTAQKEIALNTSTPTATAYAWYNMGDALKALNKTTQADAAYANATALDPTLKHP